MFTYRCPACGKLHTADQSFDKPFEAKCLRCAMAIPVTAELIHQTQAAARAGVTLPPRPELITKAPAASPAPLAPKGSSLAEAEVEEPVFEAVSLTEDDSPLDASALDDAPRKPNRSKRKEQDKDKQKKAPKKKLPRRGEDDDDEDEEDDDEEQAAPEAKRSDSPAKSTGAKGPRPRWPIIAAVSAVVLVLFVIIGFVAFGGKKADTKPRPKAAAKSAPKQPTTKPAPPPTTPTTQKTETVLKTPPIPEMILSAPQLSAELAANADFANIKYAGKVLEVSGLFLRVEQKEGLRPPARPHALFATSGALVSCDLQDSIPTAGAWSQMKPDRAFTIRGKYEKNGYLRGCWLMPEYTSTADSRYKGKTIEVTGRAYRIDDPTPLQPFPCLVLEGETNSTLEIHCLFRTTDDAEVRKIQLRTKVTVQCKCGGQEGKEGSSYIRLDNCQLVYTSAPPPNIPRVEATRLLREYESDVRPDYLPPPGEEEQVETVWTVRQLVKEHSANPDAFLKKYRNYILRFRGQLHKPPRPGDNALVLTSGDTDLTFQVDCRFDTAALEAVRKRREMEYRIRGLFTGQISKTTIRLDNCQLDMPRAAQQVVTADYLPHTPGRSFAVDVATLRTLVNLRVRDVVQREVHIQGNDGVTEVLLSHAGELGGKSLFGEGIQQKWVEDKKVRIRIPTTVVRYLRRLHAGYVEIGTFQSGQDGKTEIAWIPMLKLDAQVGDKWKWDAPAGPHEYVLEKFDDFQGHPSAVIREIFTPASDVLHPIETLHVYAKDLGEVERRQWRHLDQRGGRVLLTELKWVDKPEPGHDAKPDGKPAAKPPAPPSRPTARPRP
jgi:hypothetical protein